MSTAARRKRAEVTGSLGAGILGAGLGVLLAPIVQPAAVVLLVAGAALHGWGMWTVHRIDRDGELRTTRWVTVLYWGCWLLLALLAGALTIRRR